MVMNEYNSKILSSLTSSENFCKLPFFTYLLQFEKKNRVTNFWTLYSHNREKYIKNLMLVE